VSDDQWGDLECLYKACLAATTDKGLFTDTVNGVMIKIRIC